MTFEKDSEYWERWIRPLLAFLAADTPDQLAWSRRHRVRTAAVTEEVAFSLRLAEGMAHRGAFELAALQDLRTIDQLCGEAAGRGDPGPWADALRVDPAWAEIRSSARRILVDRLGTWVQPLPGRVLPQRDDN